MQIHEIKRTHSNKTKKIVGRGGRRGKQSGRGGKGQTARAGNKRRPAMRDIIKKYPKLRGRGIHPNKPVSAPNKVINLVDLNIFENGEVVSPASLVAKGLIDMKMGRFGTIKILGTGKLDKQLKFERVSFSASAAKALGIEIEKKEDTKSKK